LNGGRQAGANRTRASKLAQGAEWMNSLGGVQVRPTAVLEWVNPPALVVVMEDFSKEEVDHGGEKHSHKQGAYPASMRGMSCSSQAHNSPARNQEPSCRQPE